MNNETAEQRSQDPPMHVREVRLADGRYMIFFTFGDEEDEREDV